MHTKSTLLFGLILSMLFLFVACSNNDDNPIIVCKPDEIINNDPPNGTTPLEASEQRSGDREAGMEYLFYGDYVNSGIPITIYTTVFGADNTNYLNRTGDNASINHEFTAIDAPNGVRLVAANCLQCHSQVFNGDLVIGLGNAGGDFTNDQSTGVDLLDFAITNFYGANSPEWDAYLPFRRGLLVTGPEIVTEVIGANPADKLAAVLAAHRNPDDLSWSDEPLATIPEEVVPTDVPAWWLLKKKNAMFFTGVGRGDFARISMASSLLTIEDSAKAREVDEHFADVIAYINSLEAPVYSEAIDVDKVARGAIIFEQTCQACHGTYGEEETYPNLLVDHEVIQTDPILAMSNFAYDYFVEWYNNGWFNQNPNAATLVPGGGYVAPPLNGVWITAPYLHNGSVPTLQDLLNSSQRPTYWERNFNTPEYDYEKVGWKYEPRDAGGNNKIYDTTLPGYGNSGHTFGDNLSEDDRADLIEYLKTL